MRRRSGGEIFGVSFLDSIACGFGAMILLLLIAKPDPVETSATGPPPVPQVTLDAAATQVAALETRLAALQQAPAVPQKAAPEPTPAEAVSAGVIEKADAELEELKRANEGLELVKETLERATIRVPETTARRDPEVGGIPVDRDHVIFIIDTSGSMQTIWPQVVSTIERVLDIHPQVAGFQVLSDMGEYLVQGYRKKWIPDTKRRRQSVLRAFRRWQTFSNSSPVEGLETALRHYARQPQKVAIYIFGDDFTGNSFDTVLRTLDRLNRDYRTGKPRVRVHAVGFVSDPVTDRFGTLMREVTGANDGTFLALPVGGLRR